MTDAAINDEPIQDLGPEQGGGPPGLMPWTLVVEDEGPGVPDEHKLSIFEAFRRGPRSRSKPGSGIGLSLVARFAELHGGHAWVEDREGGGASFHVYLADGNADVTDGARDAVSVAR